MWNLSPWAPPAPSSHPQTAVGTFCKKLGIRLDDLEYYNNDFGELTTIALVTTDHREKPSYSWGTTPKSSAKQLYILVYGGFLVRKQQNNNIFEIESLFLRKGTAVHSFLVKYIQISIIAKISVAKLPGTLILKSVAFQGGDPHGKICRDRSETFY